MYVCLSVTWNIECQAKFRIALIIKTIRRVFRVEMYYLCHLLLFRHYSRYLSFARQVQLWGFKRVSKGPDKGSYFHNLFLKGHPELLDKIHRPKKGRRSIDYASRKTDASLMGMLQCGNNPQVTGNSNVAYLLQAQQQQQQLQHQQQLQQQVFGGSNMGSNPLSGPSSGLGMNQGVLSNMFVQGLCNQNGTMIPQNVGGNFSEFNNSGLINISRVDGEDSLGNGNGNGNNNTGNGSLSPFTIQQQQQQLHQQMLLNQAQAQAQAQYLNSIQLQQQQMLNMNFMNNSGLQNMNDASNQVSASSSAPSHNNMQYVMDMDPSHKHTHNHLLNGVDQEYSKRLSMPGNGSNSKGRM